MKKQRLDQLLVDRGIIETRSKAQAIIMSGNVFISGQKALKAGEQVLVDAEISVKELPKYVSRGGEKLESVASKLKINFTNKIVLDVGSSTGGFSDFALQHGAIKVYAVDVGSDQLNYKLRKDPRVVVMERTDIRNADLSEKADIALIDASFISLTKILEAVSLLLVPDAEIIAMAKPQFEAHKSTADKYSGVIKDETVRHKILDELETQFKAMGFSIIDSQDSGITGTQGNRERFYKLKR